MKRFLKIMIVLLVILLILSAGAYFLMKKRYPLRFEELIGKYSHEYALPEDFVCGVIWTESRFNEKAESGAGARGLMQIMPETGKWIAKKIGMEEFSEDMLFDPEVNIKMGCWYLSYLSRKFEGDELKIMAGYNAGPGNVEKWAQDGALDHEDILFPETQKYVKRVDHAKKIYGFIYNIH